MEVLPDSWFSILYSAAYHYSDNTYHAMPPRDPQFGALDVPPPALNPPVHTAISQDWDDFLLDTFGVPITPIAPIVPTAPRPEGLVVNVLRRSTSANSAHKIYVDPFSTSFISRMYSAQLPGARTPGTQLNNRLRQELDAAIIDTDSNFITSYLFPSSCLPFAIDDALFTKISTTYTTNNGEELHAVWNNIQYQPQEFPSRYTEIATAKWFNEIGEAWRIIRGKKSGESGLTETVRNRLEDTTSNGSQTFFWLISIIIQSLPPSTLLPIGISYKLCAKSHPRRKLAVVSLTPSMQNPTSCLQLNIIVALSLHWPSPEIMHSGSQFLTVKARYGTTKLNCTANDPVSYSSLSSLSSCLETMQI